LLALIIYLSDGYLQLKSVKPQIPSKLSDRTYLEGNPYFRAKSEMCGGLTDEESVLKAIKFFQIVARLPFDIQV